MCIHACRMLLELCTTKIMTFLKSLTYGKTQTHQLIVRSQIQLPMDDGEASLESLRLHATTQFFENR